MHSPLFLFCLIAVAQAIYLDDQFSGGFSTQLTLDNFDAAIKSAVDSVFGDINLSEQQIRGNHNPGAGGWPTIKYFNKETGYDGAPYVKKTSRAMCDELGDEEYMEEYVREAANIPSCIVATGEGCSANEMEFIIKWSDKSDAEQQSQLHRLEGMKTYKMKPELVKWIKQRKMILKQYLEDKDEL